MLVTMLVFSTLGVWSAAAVGVIAVLAGAILLVWARVEARATWPLVDVRLLRSRGMWTTNLCSLLVGFALIQSFLVVPQLLLLPADAGGFGVAVVNVGLYSCPRAWPCWHSAPSRAGLGARAGARTPLILGAVLCATAYTVLMLVHGEVGAVVGANALNGIGAALAFSALPNLTVRAAPVERTGVATAITTVARTACRTPGSQVAAVVLAAATPPGSLDPSRAGFTAVFAVMVAAMVLCLAVALVIPRASRALPASEFPRRRHHEKERTMHLAWFLSYAVQAWGQPWAGRPGTEWVTPELYVDAARSLERAGFDYLMFEDGSFVPDAYGSSMEWALAHGAAAPKHDPLPLVSMISRETEHIGLIATITTSLYPPYLAARLLATLDHLSSGRIGLNVVTSHNDRTAQNYGRPAQLDHDVRYEIAADWIEAVRALWDSWEPGALTLDERSGVFADPEKVHYADYVGTHHRSRGPINTPTGTSAPPGGVPGRRVPGGPRPRGAVRRHGRRAGAERRRDDRVQGRHRGARDRRRSRPGRDQGPVPVRLHVRGHR